ncbi:MAG TPA: transcriptional regulator [Ruminococcaceae bacterium]|jgi:nitrogen regulatory protein P-II 1|nr:transcriptional regulator [Oscillospiraceae bacterium]
MKRIEAFIRPEQIEDVKESLKNAGINGISVYQIMGSGCQRGWKEFIRGTEVDFNFLPKIKVELIVEDNEADSVIDCIVKTVQTGEIGDGKIFISDIQDAVRIRTGERGTDALK